MEKQLDRIREKLSPDKVFVKRLRRRLFFRHISKNVWEYLTSVTSSYFMNIQKIASIILAAIVIVAGGLSVYAYQSPEVTNGSLLYPVKRILENIEGSFATSSEAKAHFYLKMSLRRLDEGKVQTQRGHEDAATLADIDESVELFLDNTATLSASQQEEVLTHFQTQLETDLIALDPSQDLAGNLNSSPDNTNRNNAQPVVNGNFNTNGVIKENPPTTGLRPLSGLQQRIELNLQKVEDKITVYATARNRNQNQSSGTKNDNGNIAPAPSSNANQSNKNSRSLNANTVLAINANMNLNLNQNVTRTPINRNNNRPLNGNQNNRTVVNQNSNTAMNLNINLNMQLNTNGTIILNSNRNRNSANQNRNSSNGNGNTSGSKNSNQNNSNSSSPGPSNTNKNTSGPGGLLNTNMNAGIGFSANSNLNTALNQNASSSPQNQNSSPVQNRNQNNNNSLLPVNGLLH